LLSSLPRDQFDLLVPHLVDASHLNVWSYFRGPLQYSLAALGAETAKVVLRFTAGAVPPQTLTEIFSNKVMFDWRQMRRWGISEGRLPPGSEIDFREISVW
jgi:hypothetical protein